jgi:hypothetical protein
LPCVTLGVGEPRFPGLQGGAPACLTDVRGDVCCGGASDAGPQAKDVEGTRARHQHLPVCPPFFSAFSHIPGPVLVTRVAGRDKMWLCHRLGVVI